MEAHPRFQLSKNRGLPSPSSRPGRSCSATHKQHRDRLWRYVRARAQAFAQGARRQAGPAVADPAPRLLERHLGADDPLAAAGHEPVSRKPSRRARMAAQLAGAVRPTAVIMPQPRMVTGWQRHAFRLLAGGRRGPGRRATDSTPCRARAPATRRVTCGRPDIRQLEHVALERDACPPGEHQAARVRLDQDRVERGPAILAAAVSSEEHDWNVAQRQAKAGAALGRQVGEHHLLAALRARRSTGPPAPPDSSGRRSPTAGTGTPCRSSCWSYGAGIRVARLPVPRADPEPHRAVGRPRGRHRLARRLLGVGQRPADQPLAGADHAMPAADRVGM